MIWLKKIFKKISKAFKVFSEEEWPRVESLKPNLAREHLKRKCRILFIDDEKIDLVEDLKREGFSVDQDYEGNDIGKIEKGYYDLIVLDYNGVGKKYGSDQGLSLLKTIKRVNPSVYVLAYTTQNLSPSKSSEFYTLSEGSLSKDLGVGDSIARIEQGLKDSVNPVRIWNGILKCKSIAPGSSEATALEARVMKGIAASKQEEVRAILGDSHTSDEGRELIVFLAQKLFDIYTSRLSI